MKVVDRNSSDDARRVIEKIIEDVKIRDDIIKFLSSGISYANNCRSDNWNLNLDKKGEFIRFNTGRSFCIEIRENGILVLCMRSVVEKLFPHQVTGVKFHGEKAQTGEFIYDEDLENVSDVLAGVKDSVGCFLNYDKVRDYLGSLEETNRRFIDSAIMNAKIWSQSKTAHSTGCIEYISQVLQKKMPNPSYVDYFELQEKQLKDAMSLSQEERLRQIESNDSKIPDKRIANSNYYIRSAVVRAEVLYRAKGYCAYCKNAAPFKTKKDQRPYLEVHHIVPLAKGGKDTLENTVALCPNCHRQTHLGDVDIVKLKSNSAAHQQ